MTKHADTPSYSQFACIGAGFSAIGLGATLQRWYGITDVCFFERHADLGGTWFAARYPGCACDVPSALYSFSFAQNPSWTKTLPPSEELWAYLKRVAAEYDLPRRMMFGVDVVACRWVPATSRWRLTVRQNHTGHVFEHECQFLFAASGQLVTPRPLDVPGVESFRGALFHSSQWRADVPLENKNVVVIGNGCTATQIVPQIVGQTKHLTQIVRSAHWILPGIDGRIGQQLRTLSRLAPGGLGTALARLLVFAVAELELLGFPMTRLGAAWRRRRRRQAEAYMRATAPTKYHDILVPDFEVGCKRRIFDTGYLASLHAANLTLTKDAVLEVVPEGIRTTSGLVPADVIVLANGYATNTFLTGIEVTGEDGMTLNDHWRAFGGAEAYNCSTMSGFPNFFVLLGPNAATGHTSTLMAAENSINLALRVIRPVLEGRASAVGVRHEAEAAYVDKIQAALQKTVWSSGCSSWYVRGTADGSAGGQGKTWNAMSYPYSQAYYWWRSFFPTWSDWQYTGPPSGTSSIEKKSSSVIRLALLTTAVTTAVTAYVVAQRPEDVRHYVPLVKARFLEAVKSRRG